MTRVIDIDEIFRDDLANPVAEQSLPWEETRDGITVVVEPKPHWAEDLPPSVWRRGNTAATPTGRFMAPGHGSLAMPICPATRS